MSKWRRALIYGDDDGGAGDVWDVLTPDSPQSPPSQYRDMLDEVEVWQPEAPTPTSTPNDADMQYYMGRTPSVRNADLTDIVFTYDELYEFAKAHPKHVYMYAQPGTKRGDQQYVVLLRTERIDELLERADAMLDKGQVRAEFDASLFAINMERSPHSMRGLTAAAVITAPYVLHNISLTTPLQSIPRSKSQRGKLLIADTLIAKNYIFLAYVQYVAYRRRYTPQLSIDEASVPTDLRELANFEIQRGRERHHIMQVGVKKGLVPVFTRTVDGMRITLYDVADAFKNAYTQALAPRSSTRTYARNLVVELSHERTPKKTTEISFDTMRFIKFKENGTFALELSASPAATLKEYKLDKKDSVRAERVAELIKLALLAELTERLRDVPDVHTDAEKNTVYKKHESGVGNI